jgi:glucosamine--fructose-6-phosphate aminotransferase (isomerizing)
LEDCVHFSKKVAKEIKHSKHIFLISNGIGEIVAKEGALKIKELTYTHCQSLNMNNCSNHFFNYLKKHPETPVIFIVLDDKHKETNIESMRKIAEKVKFLGVVITDLKDKTSLNFFEHFSGGRVFNVPKSGYMSALLCVMPLQRLAYDLTLELGYDPDRPRNLAKELTTK